MDRCRLNYTGYLFNAYDALDNILKDLVNSSLVGNENCKLSACCLINCVSNDKTNINNPEVVHCSLSGW